MSMRNLTRALSVRASVLILSIILLGGAVAGCNDDDGPVTPANAAPVGATDSYYVARGATLVVDDGVLANDSDADGHSLTAVLVTAPVNHVGTFTLNSDGSFTYVHDGSALPNDSFTYVADDGQATSAEVVVAITYPVVSEVGSFGADTISRDLATGMRWLDVSASTPYSYDQLMLEFGAGGVFEGFRLATAHEVRAFWANAGIDTTLSGFVSENFQPVVDLMGFVSVTGDAGNLGGGNVFDYTAGHVESGPGGDWVSVGTISADPDPTLTGRQGFGTVPSDNTNATHGAWLIGI